MSRKKILIINPGTLFPKVMAFQDRVINIIKCLNENHLVDVISLYTKEEEKELSERNLKNICNRYYLIRKPNHSFFRKKIYGFIVKVIQLITFKPFETFYPNWFNIKKEIYSIIKRTKYDVIQIEAWWQCSIFKNIPYNTLKVIDTHDVMYEKRELEYKHKYKDKISIYGRLYLKEYKRRELYNTSLADLIISISKPDLDVLKKHFPEKEHLMVPLGQELSAFIDYPKNSNGRTVLFYGSLGGKQNIVAFWRLYKSILPKIKNKLESIKLIILGANPTNDIKELHNGEDVIVTGYVNDVREYISQSDIMILPLEISGGFRGRIIEVMGMGVPILGTHNALDCMGMNNDEHGYISDNDDEISSYAINLLKDKKKYNDMGMKCKDFVKKHYSFESTYYKLAKYYNNIE